MTKQSSESFGKLRKQSKQSSESFGKLRKQSKQSSERFRKLRKQKAPLSESFGKLPNVSERTTEHTLTVREVAKTFENKGIPRTERSIINWCHPNRQGLTRLDCYFEENEGKYFITPISVERVIAEEQNKLKIKAQTSLSEDQQPSSESLGSASEAPDNLSEGFGKEPNRFGKLPNISEADREALSEQIKKLEYQILDLKITSRGKNELIGFLREERNNFMSELLEQREKIGVLKTRLLQLQAPSQKPTTKEDQTQTVVDVENEVESAGTGPADEIKDN